MKIVSFILIYGTLAFGQGFDDWKSDSVFTSIPVIENLIEQLNIEKRAVDKSDSLALILIKKAQEAGNWKIYENTRNHYKRVSLFHAIDETEKRIKELYIIYQEEKIREAARKK